DNITPSLPSPLDDYHQYQELLQRFANDLQNPLEEIQDPQHQLLNSSQPQGQIRVTLPINKVILEPAGEV
ncbi:hypothetical protein KIL84_011208, partial [Mauremys mutica]